MSNSEEMIDFHDKDFQRWLEARLEDLVAMPIRSLAIVAVNSEEEAVCGRYAMDVNDMRKCAFALLDSAMLEVIANNESNYE